MLRNLYSAEVFSTQNVGQMPGKGGTIYIYMLRDSVLIHVEKFQLLYGLRARALSNDCLLIN